MFNARMFDISLLEAEEMFNDMMEDFESTWDGDRRWQDMEEQQQSMETPGLPLQNEAALM